MKTAVSLNSDVFQKNFRIFEIECSVIEIGLMNWDFMKYFLKLLRHLFKISVILVLLHSFLSVFTLSK